MLKQPSVLFAAIAVAWMSVPAVAQTTLAQVDSLPPLIVTPSSNDSSPTNVDPQNTVVSDTVIPTIVPPIPLTTPSPTATPTSVAPLLLTPSASDSPLTLAPATSVVPLTTAPTPTVTPTTSAPTSTVTITTTDTSPTPESKLPAIPLSPNP
ncbi:MAG TPA: hypothetical protein V6D11_08585 [Waterburya sp.]